MKKRKTKKPIRKRNERRHTLENDLNATFNANISHSGLCLYRRWNRVKNPYVYQTAPVSSRCSLSGFYPRLWLCFCGFTTEFAFNLTKTTAYMLIYFIQLLPHFLLQTFLFVCFPKLPWFTFSFGMNFQWRICVCVSFVEHERTFSSSSRSKKSGSNSI